MPREISKEELAEIKSVIRAECEQKMRDLGQDGFITWLVDSLCEAGRTLADIKERLEMGRGPDF